MATRMLGSFIDKQPILGGHRVSRELMSSIGSSSGSLVSIRSSNHGPELAFLEHADDFIITHNRTKEFWSCSCSLFYDIFNGTSKRRILTCCEEHSCFFVPDVGEKIIFHDDQKHPVLQLEQTESKGYISRRSIHVVSSPPGYKIGEISRIIEFLESPRYEINDVHGDALYSLSVCIASLAKTIDIHVGSKTGKVAHIQESKGQISMKIFTMCSVNEKALLLSLVILLDIARRSDF